MLYSQVAGQEEIKTSLIKSIDNNQVSHCYLFEGPEGMGKFELALVFAQSLLCLNFHKEPCNKCKNCIKVNSLNHPDLHIINKDGNSIKREDIDLVETENYTPAMKINSTLTSASEVRSSVKTMASTYRDILAKRNS